MNSYQLLKNSFCGGFEECVALLAFDGGKSATGHPGPVVPLRSSPDQAGFAYFSGTRLIGKILFTRTLKGGISIQWRFIEPVPEEITRTFGEGDVAAEPLRSYCFEPDCPVLDFLYRCAYAEYRQLKEGRGNTGLIGQIESACTRVRAHHRVILPSPRLGQNLERDLDSLARDPVYTWKERLQQSRRMKHTYREIAALKHRVHRKSGFAVHRWPSRALGSLRGMGRRFLIRPIENLTGLWGYLFLDPLHWFLGVVRANLGYSMALAVYSPFTFFFITQPMNPHAMWAVGKVRNAAIDLLETQRKPIPDPRHIPGDWGRRMDGFKSLQIKLEENLHFSSRMGRLEHLETQLGWPMAVEGAWNESRRYLDLLNALAAKKSSPLLTGLLRSETGRTRRFRWYLWDRTLRFMLDHPWVALDPEGEQRGAELAIQRIRRLYREMSDAIRLEMPDAVLPREGQWVLEGLSSTPVESTPDVSSPRSRWIHHWDRLYLLQSKAQESAQAGLQLYAWSIRNTISTFQYFLSTKREELALLALHSRPSPSFTDHYRHARYLLQIEFDSIRSELESSLPQDSEAGLRLQLLADLDGFLKEREELM
jgi:hypothetical protein